MAHGGGGYIGGGAPRWHWPESSNVFPGALNDREGLDTQRQNGSLSTINDFFCHAPPGSGLLGDASERVLGALQVLEADQRSGGVRHLLRGGKREAEEGEGKREAGRLCGGQT